MKNVNWFAVGCIAAMVCCTVFFTVFAVTQPDTFMEFWRGPVK